MFDVKDSSFVPMAEFLKTLPKTLVMTVVPSGETIFPVDDIGGWRNVVALFQGTPYDMPDWACHAGRYVAFASTQFENEEVMREALSTMHAQVMRTPVRSDGPNIFPFDL